MTKLDEADLPLPGACFKAYPDAEEIFEWQIAEFCDDADGANDGTMRYVGLEPGPYLLEEIVTPVGYLPLAAPLPFVLTEGQTTTVPVRNALGGIARVLLTGPDAAPLPGACFYLYTDNPGPNGPFVASRCDGDDGEPDGQATFVGLETGGHRVLAQAPEGYYVPTEVPFQAQAGETVDVPIGAQEVGRWSSAGRTPTASPILGGCIVIYVDEGGGALGRNTGTICDGMYGGRDGSATVRIPPGCLRGGRRVPAGRLPSRPEPDLHGHVRRNRRGDRRLPSWRSSHDLHHGPDRGPGPRWMLRGLPGHRGRDARGGRGHRMRFRDGRERRGRHHHPGRT